MAIYSVSVANWNDPSFWSAISETAPGNTLDFSALGPSFSVIISQSTNQVTIFDGATTFIVGEPGDGGVDATFGGTTQLSYFDTKTGTAGNDTVDASAETTNLVPDGSAGDDSVIGGAGDDTYLITGAGAGADSVSVNQNDGIDTINGGTGSDTLDFDGNFVSGVSVTLTGATDGSYTFDTAGSGTFSNFERFLLTDQDDSLDGSAGTTGSLCAWRFRQ